MRGRREREREERGGGEREREERGRGKREREERGDGEGRERVRGRREREREERGGGEREREERGRGRGRGKREGEGEGEGRERVRGKRERGKRESEGKERGKRVGYMYRQMSECKETQQTLVIFLLSKLLINPVARLYAAILGIKKTGLSNMCWYQPSVIKKEGKQVEKPLGEEGRRGGEGRGRVRGKNERGEGERVRGWEEGRGEGE